MNRAIIGTLIAIILGILGVVGYFVFSSDSEEPTSTQTVVTEQPETTEQIIESNSEVSPSVPETYVTLANYNSATSVYEQQTKVYFFHASWCPICRSIDEDIQQNPSRIPTNVTLIKTDFDDETELRQKYGVTYQYTFVQVDNDGNLIKKWSATNLDKVLDGIEG